ncbi:MAG: ADP-forming succinate--CoA ligase subunit beta [Thermodesulfobacteriota bacterium]
MNIHEYQAKELFRRYGIPVPAGRMVEHVDAAAEVIGELGLPLVVKAQIHAGGRGKGGGVRLARSAAEASQHVRDILGMTLVTAQTGPGGRVVRKILLEEGVAVARELYLSLAVDRKNAAVAVIVSESGGMNIEELAAARPDAVVRLLVNPLLGLKNHHLLQALAALDLEAAAAREFGGLLRACYRLFVEQDCSLVEINPLVVTGDGGLLALDAKIAFDDNGLFRHPELAGLRDEGEESPLEVEAAKFGLNYISLDGTIGNMVNGAGLAMATMDIIQQAGAAPANFLDVGGGASATMVENGLRIILSDPRVEGILINIFGGILRCDVLAEGVVEAARKVGLPVPVVVRMEGTNVEAGRKILADSGLDLVAAVDLADAAAKVAAIAAAGKEGS